MTAQPAPAPAQVEPRKPVVTTETQTQEEPISFETKIEYTSKEYSSFSQMKQQGKAGLRRIITKVNMTDGVETSRQAPTTEVATPAEPQIILKGSRISPEARITRFWGTDKKDRYDIRGVFKPNAEVVLSVNGKKIKRANTDGQGVFLFKGIKITEEKPELIIYERHNGKEHQVSEKTFVDKKSKNIWTEYQQLHKR